MTGDCSVHHAAIRFHVKNALQMWYCLPCPFAIPSSWQQIIPGIVAVDARLWHTSSPILVWSFPNKMHHAKIIPLQYTSMLALKYLIARTSNLDSAPSLASKILGKIHITHGKLDQIEKTAKTLALCEPSWITPLLFRYYVIGQFHWSISHL